MVCVHPTTLGTTVICNGQTILLQSQDHTANQENNFRSMQINLLFNTPYRCGSSPVCSVCFVVPFAHFIQKLNTNMIHASTPKPYTIVYITSKIIPNFGHFLRFSTLFGYKIHSIVLVIMMFESVYF